ncbi:MAG: DMT family transporter [Planctomycetes bacterium]|nr:DMT family transporter [Planctomycetota bacterium]
MFILLDRVTHVMGPVEIALWRFGGGAAVLGFIWWLTQRDYRLSRGEWAKIVFIALVFNAPPQIVLAYLIHQGFGHSFFGPMVAPIPLITILVSIPLLGVWPTGRQLVGVLGGLACMWLIVDDGFDRGMSLTFVALALAIPVASAVCNTIIKWKLGRVPAVPLTTAILIVAGLSLAPLQFSPSAMDALHLANPTTDPTAITWVYLFILGVVGTGLSTAVFVWLILVRGPLFAGMTTYVVPIVSLVWGSFDHERISVQQMAAIAGVLAMVALVQLGSRRESVVVEPAAPEGALVTLPLNAESLAVQPESQVA